MDKNQNKRNDFFIKACSGGFADVVGFMLNVGGLDLNYSDIENHTALWYAVHNKYSEIVKQLICFGGIDQMTMSQAISEAHKQGDTELRNFLLEHLYSMLQSIDQSKLL